MLSVSLHRAPVVPPQVRYDWTRPWHPLQSHLLRYDWSSTGSVLLIKRLLSSYNLTAMASKLEAMASNLVAMASNLIAMASKLEVMASNLVPMASNLTASNLFVFQDQATSI